MKKLYIEASTKLFEINFEALTIAMVRKKVLLHPLVSPRQVARSRAYLAYYGYIASQLQLSYLYCHSQLAKTYVVSYHHQRESKRGSIIIIMWSVQALIFPCL